MGEIHREFNHWLSLSCPANSLPLSTANHRRTSKSLGDTRPSQIKISRSDLNLWEMADGLYKEGWTDGNSNRMNNSETDLILEKLLVARAQERDESAFRELVMRYERRMLYYLHRLLGNHTDLADVMQEIWMRVFLRITTLRTPEAFRVWLYKIAHDVAVNQIRKNRRHEIALWDDVSAAEESQTSDWNEYELLENAELVHNALERLSLPHREVLALRFLESLDVSEIAEVVGCNVGTVKSRLHYAKSAMRKLLESNSYE